MRERYPAQITNMIIESLQASNDGVGVFNQDDVLVFCNTPMATAFGFASGDALGLTFEQMLRISAASDNGVKADHGDVDAMVERALAARLKRGFSSFDSDHTNGNWTHVSRLRTDNDYVFVYTSDITTLKKTESELKDALRYMQKLAATDSLTGLSNRRHFLDAAQAEFSRSKRYEHNLSILALDIDHFKNVNDTYGHQAGDKVLEAISQCCSDLLRTGDIFGRLGGEEFSILLPNADSESAKVTAQRVLDAVAALEVNYEDQVIHFTTSIGIAQVQHCEDLPELMKHSDEALYQAKHNGRNRYEVWH